MVFCPCLNLPLYVDNDVEYYFYAWQRIIMKTPLNYLDKRLDILFFK